MAKDVLEILRYLQKSDKNHSKLGKQIIIFYLPLYSIFFVMSHVVYLTHFLSYKLLFLYLLSTIKRMCPSFGHGMLTQTRAFTHIPHLACHIIMHELKNKKDKRSANLTIVHKYDCNFHAL